MTSFEISLPAVRGTQAGRDFFVTMCPAATLTSLFSESNQAVNERFRESNFVNEKRIPEIVRYMTTQQDSYIFSAMTAVVDSDVRFEPISNNVGSVGPGTLHISLSANLLLLDGQHRCAALKQAVAANKELGDECIPVVVFVDPGLRRSDSMFNDLKCHERKASQSLRLLHETKDQVAVLTREMVEHIPVLQGMIELKKSTISNRSRKLFTLSAFYHANKLLLTDYDLKSPHRDPLQVVIDFWLNVSEQFPQWRAAKSGDVSPADLRRQFIHVHGIALAAIARVGNTILQRNPRTWVKKLRRLRSVDWSRQNTLLWQGRAMIAGRLSKSTINVVLTGNALKQHLGVPLTDEEQQAEEEFVSGRENR